MDWRHIYKLTRRVGNQKPSIEKGQTQQWPKEKGQKDKQRFTKHYTEN